MTERNRLDRPAMAFSLVVGVVLIAASLPFVIMLWYEPFGIAWSERTESDDSAQVTGATSPQALELPVSDAFTSAIEVRLEDCTDTPATGAGASEVTIVVRRDGEELDRATTTCDGETEFRFDVNEIPAVGKRKAPDAAEATVRAMDDLDNETARYTVEVSVVVQAGAIPGGLPLPGAVGSFSSNVEAEALAWRAEQAPEEEVVR